MIIYKWKEGPYICMRARHFLAECVTKIDLRSANDDTIAGLLKGLEETEDDVVISRRPEPY